MKIAPLLLVLISLSVSAEECKVSGHAILWAYDSCFWKYEADDSIHPEVLECVEKSQEEIRTLGECPSRRLFKSRICSMAKEWNMQEPDPAQCMEEDKALGPAVRDRSI